MYYGTCPVHAIVPSEVPVRNWDAIVPGEVPVMNWVGQNFQAGAMAWSCSCRVLCIMEHAPYMPLCPVRCL
jgi:hypothetical protein